MAEENLPLLRDHAIIAGYGVPGRAFAEWMTLKKLPFVVIEKNESIVERCSATGASIIAGIAGMNRR